MKTNKLGGLLFYVAAVLFYLSAIINFVGGNRSTGVVLFSLGSAFLCFGSIYINKKCKDDEEKKQ